MATNRGARVTLVERFIDFREWPTNRKSLYVAGLLAPGHLVIAGLTLAVRPPALESGALVEMNLWGVAVSIAIGALSWVSHRRGNRGDWTGYLLVWAYGAWVLVFLISVGTLSSPFLAFPVVIPLFMMLWFGAKFGVWSASCVLLLSIGGGVLTVTHVLPLAPLVKSRSIDALNTPSWLAILWLVLGFASLAIWATALLALAAADLNRRRLVVAHGLIRRYVPEQVADAVLSGAPEDVTRHERRKLTIFFSDLVGFTDLSEELEPEDLANVLHNYFTQMSAIARRHGGTVDDLVGDAILVLFGAPDQTDDRDQALRAVRMAVEMQEAMGPLNERWASAGIPETLRVRMGINTGIATVGNFGSEERTKYTALGKQVNIAARIQSHCEPGKVLLSHPTWLLVRDHFACTSKGELTLKGLHKPMPAYEVQT